MNKIYFLILSPLIILSSFSAFGAEKEFTCFQSKVKLSYTDGKVTETPTELCSNKDRTSLRSKNCLNLECVPRDKVSRLKFSEVYSDGNSPAFTVCSLSGGKPELLEFYADKEWYALDRCNYKTGFVNVGILLTLLQPDK